MASVAPAQPVHAPKVPKPATGGLPEWVPFVTKQKARSTPAYNVNQRQPVQFPEDFDILGQVTLQLSNLGNNNNKYYALELHHAGNLKTQSYRIFCHFGRTCDLASNPKAGQKANRYYNDLETARLAFQNLYDEKTRKGYNPLQLLSSNVGSDRARDLRQSSGEAEDEEQEGQSISALHTDVQKLVRHFYQEAS